MAKQRTARRASDHPDRAASQPSPELRARTDDFVRQWGYLLLMKIDPAAARKLKANDNG